MNDSSVRLTTIGVVHYSNASWLDVSDAGEAIDRLTKLLGMYGFTAEDLSDHATDPTRILQMLKTWATTPSSGSVVYWTGHGSVDANGYHAALAISDEALDSGNSVSHLQLAERLQDRQRRRHDGDLGQWVVLILDTCGSRLGARHVYVASGDLPNTVVIGTAEDDGVAFAGRFVDLLADVLAGFGGNDEGGIRIDEVLRRLRERLAPTVSAPQHIFGEIHSSITMPLPSTRAPAALATIDAQREFEKILGSVAPQVRNHFFAKAKGTELGTPAWHFTGRIEERRRIVDWLASTTHGLLVVAGRSGSGKSALLGMLLASSDPSFRAVLADLGYPAIPPETCPPSDAFTAAIHLSGLTIKGAVEAIAGAVAGVETDDADLLANALLSRHQYARPITLLLDALDESRDPTTIAALVRRLAAIPGVRIVVGTRVSLSETPDKAPSDEYLLSALGRGILRVNVTDDPHAILEYVEQRLKGRLPENATLNASDVARKVAERRQPFLFARLAVFEILADPDYVASESHLSTLLDNGHSGIFTLAVERVRASDGPAEALLHALAYARGNGFPRSDGIWAAAGSALAAAELTDLDVARALEVAAPYIMEDTEFGQAVYRLAHRTFAEHYWAHDVDQDE